MQKIITILNNTYRVVKLLSDPKLVDRLQNQTVSIAAEVKPSKLGQGDLYHHKHFMIQVVG